MDRREERRAPCEAVGRVGRGEVEEAVGEVDIRTLGTTVWGREEEDIVVRIGPVVGVCFLRSFSIFQRQICSILSLSGS